MLISMTQFCEFCKNRVKKILFALNSKDVCEKSISLEMRKVKLNDRVYIFLV